MTAEELRRIETRSERSYDEQGVSTVVVWRGPTMTLACSSDRAMNAALVRAVLA